MLQQAIAALAAEYPELATRPFAWDVEQWNADCEAFEHRWRQAGIKRVPGFTHIEGTIPCGARVRNERGRMGHVEGVNPHYGLDPLTYYVEWDDRGTGWVMERGLFVV